jgi:beta-fructofuranosidase
VLRLADHWIWDAWAADDGERHHLFFLQAPRSLGDPERRHLHARVGHASSTDLVDWTYHGECLGPAATGFDDRAIWTGSVVRGDDRWWMFYSAVSWAGPHLSQRIGCAVSTDLHTWERRPGPVVAPDPRWYAGDGDSSPTWRDPFVLPDPGGDGWHMLLTAAAAGADPAGAGVIGHATSPDLRTWTPAPPLSTPAGFRHLEVAQTASIDGRAVLAFTCHPAEQVAARPWCTWSVPATGPLGPWDVTAAGPFEADPWLFAAPLVRRRDGGWVLLGFRNLEPAGGDGFAIHDPIPVTLDRAGRLRAR